MFTSQSPSGEFGQRGNYTLFFFFSFFLSSNAMTDIQLFRLQEELILFCTKLAVS